MARLHWLGVLVLVVAITASCGDDADGKSDDTDASTTPGDAAESASVERKPLTAVRQPFCSELRPKDVAAALGVKKAGVLVDREPGDEFEFVPGGDTYTAQEWTCVIGQEGGPGISVAWRMLKKPGTEKSIDSWVDSQKQFYDGGTCTPSDDQVLGPATIGGSCARPESSGRVAHWTYAAAFRAALIEDVFVDCLVHSDDAGDLARLDQTVGAACPLVLEAIAD